MIFLGLGSNLGEREQNIIDAITILAAHPAIKIDKTSSFYETSPVGYLDQPDFLNAVISIESSLTPEQLLAVCLDAEERLGRIRTLRWGPRTIDIDILIFHDIHCQTDSLTLPHPRLRERCFVLAPLAEIAPPVPLLDGLTPHDLLGNCQTQDVRLYKQLIWEEK